MLKALDLLKLQYDHHLNIFKDNKELGNPFEDKYILYLKEAIAELEVLENRKCDNCKHYKQSSTQIYKTCYANKVNGFNLESDIDFCCNKWEVKNEF